MPKPVASPWRSLPDDFVLKIDRCLSRACEQRESRGPVPVFFRADDIGVPGRQFARLITLFSSFRVPLSLAVVPAWLTRTRWQQIRKIGKATPELWCWHQHGWRHANHETQGKKQEFGASRPASRIRRDLTLGRHRLESLMGNDFYPVFTPPWNRCGRDTLSLLKELNYRAVSRSCGSLPHAPQGLPEFGVNVDLHTRRAPGSRIGWPRLLSELGNAVKSGACGIMIHHQLMTAAAFEFLEVLLTWIASHKEMAATDFREMVASPPAVLS